MSDTAGQGSSRRVFLKTGGAAVGLAALSASIETSTATPASAARATPAGAGGVSATPFGTPTPSIPDPGVNITAVTGDRVGNWLRQKRSEVVARHGAVATSQSIAAQAGLNMLAQGGNAADAAVTTAAVLALVEPESTGLGADMFVIYYSAKDRKLFGLNSSGWAPKAWDLAYFNAKGFNAKTGMPHIGVDSVSVPGAVEGWDQLLRRFGTRRFDTVLEPAAQLAEQGFGVTERIHVDWESGVDVLKTDPDSARVYLPGGKAPAMYSVFRNPDLAHALNVLRRKGRDAYYKGEIAQAIVAKIKKLGGAMTAADLAGFRAEWVEPLSTNYHGYDIHEMPPNSQGFAALEMINIVGQIGPVLGIDLAGLGSRSPLFWHLIVEAKKLAYDDLHTFNGDPRFTKVPLDRLLSADYAKAQAKKINPQHAAAPKVNAGTTGGTIYLTAADRWGNMASFIYSIFDTFGSGITVPGYGFLLQDRAALFSLDPSSPNVVAGHKRPFHTLIPAFVTKDGHPVLSFGNMGGAEQPQAQVTELINMIDLGMNPQAATDAARFYHDQASNTLFLESELFDLVGAQLTAMGHRVRNSRGADLMGGYQAIHFAPETPGQWPAATGQAPGSPVNGVYRAASDHRKDGEAVGW